MKYFYIFDGDEIVARLFTQNKETAKKELEFNKKVGIIPKTSRLSEVSGKVYVKADELRSSRGIKVKLTIR